MRQWLERLDFDVQFSFYAPNSELRAINGGCVKLFSAVMALIVFGVSVSANAEKIEDNSFLVEEAYNQEPGVIQHIFTWQRKTEGAWDASFTEEVPVVSQSHQLSATVPYSRTADPAGQSGLGDVLLNYRYQWLANDIAAVAPRLSVVFPSGDSSRGLGVGATGLQMNMPVSVSINDEWVTHLNVGWTYLADAKNTSGQKATNTSVSFGGSVIYLMSETFNLMFEMVGAGKESTVAEKVVGREISFTLSPGVRYAINTSAAQIVLGAALPIETLPGRGAGLFLYASFEHSVGAK